MSSFKIIPPNDIPPETAKELERLHALLREQPDRFEWTSAQLEKFYSILLNPMVINEEVGG